MAVYQKRFSYNNRNNDEFGMRVVAFSPDEGEVDTFLSMESIYTENYLGTIRHDYGAKYNSVPGIYITMVKNNYSDFSRNEVREIATWLTGLRRASWLDLYNDDTEEISFSFLGRITDLKLQKMDSRVIGIKAEFTSVSPWAYSAIRRHDIILNGNEFAYPICNSSDEDSVYVYPKVTFINKVSNGSLRIFNTTTREETLLKGLAMNEVITMDSNKIIYSDNEVKVFGDNFNFSWLRFVLGYNHINVSGSGYLSIEYRDMYKVADAFDDADYMNIIDADIGTLLLTDITLNAANWEPVNVEEGTIITYSQELTIPNSTEYSKIDLQPTEEQLLALQYANIEFQIINNDGIITAYSYGGVPTVDYTLQATIDETNVDITSRHASMVLYANAWYNQGDIYYQPVYIKGVTKDSIINMNLTEAQLALLEDNSATIFVKNNRGETIAYAVGYKPDYDYYADLTITETTTDPSKAKANVVEGAYVEPLYF